MRSHKNGPENYYYQISLSDHPFANADDDDALLGSRLYPQTANESL